MDINRIWLSGVVVGETRCFQLPSGTPIVTFLLKVRETFNDKEGVECERDSIFVIENLGKSSERAKILAKDGVRIVVDGYLRADNGKVKIRTYTLYIDKSLEALSYKEGLKKAISILDESRNVFSAKKVLQNLMEDT